LAEGKLLAAVEIGELICQVFLHGEMDKSGIFIYLSFAFLMVYCLFFVAWSSGSWRFQLLFFWAFLFLVMPGRITSAVKHVDEKRRDSNTA